MTELRSTSHLSILSVLSIALALVVAAFALFGLYVTERTSSNTDLIRSLTARVEALEARTCQDFNDSAARRNSVIREAIDAERAKGSPDPQALDSLARSLFPLRDCP